jgi:hypothetical protein
MMIIGCDLHTAGGRDLSRWELGFGCPAPCAFCKGRVRRSSRRWRLAPPLGFL